MRQLTVTEQESAVTYYIELKGLYFLVIEKVYFLLEVSTDFVCKDQGSKWKKSCTTTKRAPNPSTPLNKARKLRYAIWKRRSRIVIMGWKYF